MRINEQTLLERVKNLEAVCVIYKEHMCALNYYSVARVIDETEKEAISSAHELLHQYAEKYTLLETTEGMIKRLRS